MEPQKKERPAYRAEHWYLDGPEHNKLCVEFESDSVDACARWLGIKGRSFSTSQHIYDQRPVFGERRDREIAWPESLLPLDARRYRAAQYTFRRIVGHGIQVLRLYGFTALSRRDLQHMWDDAEQVLYAQVKHEIENIKEALDDDGYCTVRGDDAVTFFDEMHRLLKQPLISEDL